MTDETMPPMDRLKKVDLSKPLHLMWAVPSVLVLVQGIFLAGIKAELPGWLGVVTKAEAAQNSQAIHQVDMKVDSLAYQVKFNQAFQQVAAFQSEVNQLMDRPEDTLEYRKTLRKASAKLELAKRYRDCLVEHDAHDTDHLQVCDLLQKQLWQ